jgi:NAD(P)-dependent dehydrogenase (short-subunit alcohol dehydrogenase family)
MWTTDNITSQAGKVIIVTGANTGIGYETALALYQKGAHVVIACRNAASAAQAIAKMEAQGGNGSLEAGVLDLADLVSVQQFAEGFKQKHGRLHVLINNAGVAMPPASLTAQGYELQFGVNFLGHFALTGHLYPLLKTTDGARVVTLSSMGYLTAVIDFDNLRSELSYDAMSGYRRSKLADIIFSVELARRIAAAGDDVISVTAQPGANNTELMRHLSPEAIAAGKQQLGEFMEPWQGALPSLYAATMPDVRGGELYEPNDGGYRGYPEKGTILPNALDEELANKLWQMAEEATGVSYPAAHGIYELRE